MTEKMRMETADMTEKNIEKIGELFPNCITESKDENGNLKKAINFDVLKQMLSKEVIDGDEAYEFTWVGKKAAMLEANKPIRKTLRPCPEESVNWDTTENLYIEGDNLEVLKLLQESYLGKVKMIYIDPPYNTGKDSFVYPDDYSIDRDEYEKISGRVNEDGKIVFRENPESNPRFHSLWCSMMYSRLLLVRSLLSEDGVIFISIDSKEFDNTKKICDEIFQASNYVGTLIIETATDNNARQISIEHEYMHCYAKNLNVQDVWTRKNEAAQKIKDQYLKLKNKGLSNSEIQEQLRIWIKANKDELPQVTHYDNVDDKGVFHDGDIANTIMGGYKYEVIHPLTGKPCKIPEKGFRFPQKTMMEMLKNDEILFGPDETTLIKPKKRIENAKELLRSIIYEDGRASTKIVDGLIGRGVFKNPKQLNILRRIIDFTTNKDSIILDFFSGSATTAHAVMQLNAEDGGKRKFIMVQLQEPCDEKSEAYKAGFKNICEIGKERIRRAGKKINEELGVRSEELKLDVGFRVFKLDDSNMKDVYYSADEYSQKSLSDLESNIKEDRTDLDLLFGCLLEWGLPLSMPYSSEKIEGFNVHTYNDGDLIACFDANIPESVIKTIAKRKPLRAVFRDSSFADSPSKINVTEIFKLISPNTKVKVI